METNPLTRPAAEKVLHYAAHSAQLIRDAIQRELEAELRGLLMTARLQGFGLVVEEASPHVVDLRA